MGNTTIKDQKKISGKFGAFIKSIFSVIAILFCTMFAFSACGMPSLQVGDEQTLFDEYGNLRLLAPDVKYNYTTLDEVPISVAGSFSWDFSYYTTDKVYSAEADEQLLGDRFYTTAEAYNIAVRILNGDSTVSETERKYMNENLYHWSGSGATNPAPTKGTGNYWYGKNGMQLYRICKTNIAIPSYQVVVDGVTLTFNISISGNKPLVSIVNDGKIDLTQLVITYKDENNNILTIDGENISTNEYFRIIENSTVKKDDDADYFKTGRNGIESFESGIPYARYTIVFNPRLMGTATTRNIKVRALPTGCENRGISPYSNTITYNSSRLAFSVYSQNSADQLSEIGYMSYDSSYYFNKIRKSTTENVEDAKIVYLEGNFPEGRIVKVKRVTYEYGDYALSCWTVNKQALSSPAYEDTMPEDVTNASFFNYANFNTDALNVSITDNPNKLIFYANLVDDNDNKLSSLFPTTLNIDTKNEIFNEQKIENPDNIADNGYYLSVVSNKKINGFTFYANFAKVRNFTVSGTVFAGDEFFSNTNTHYLTDYSLQVYEVNLNQNEGVAVSYSNNNNVYNLNATNNGDVISVIPIINTNSSSASDYTTIDGRTIHISVEIKGSEFVVKGLEHNMIITFTKTSENDNTSSSAGGLKTAYSFHNATMVNSLVDQVITKGIFVNQSDRVLTGIIGTEYAESSNLDIQLFQVRNEEHSYVDPSVGYEIISSVTTKEDIHGYVTTNVILSVNLPQDTLLVGYNIETPLISSTIKYNAENSGNYYVYDAANNRYYKVSEHQIYGVVSNDTAQVVTYHNKLYYYSHRNSTTNSDGTSIFYNSYYMATPDVTQSDNDFECIKVSYQQSGTITYTLCDYQEANVVVATIVSGSESEGNKTVAFAIVNDEQSAIDALAYISDEQLQTMPNILINNYYAGKYTPEIYEINATKDNVTTFTVSEDINSDIAVKLVAYKPTDNGLKLTKDSEEERYEQNIYFYYDVASTTVNGITTYYYTSPIGRRSSDGSNVWFYDFDSELATTNPDIMLGKDIPTSSAFYKLVNQGLVSFYYYYVGVLTPETVYVRQYSDTVIAPSGEIELYTDPGLSPETRYYGEFIIKYSTTSLYSTIEIDGEKYRVYFNPYTFKYIVTEDEDGAEDLGFTSSMDFENSICTVYVPSTIGTFTSYVFEGDLKESATYTSSNNGGDINLTIAYNAFYVEDFKSVGYVAFVYDELRINGNFIVNGDGSQKIIVNPDGTASYNDKEVVIFPEFTLTITDENLDTKTYVLLEKGEGETLQQAMLVSNVNVNFIKQYFKKDDPSFELFAKDVEKAVYYTKREAFTLDNIANGNNVYTTNAKTQICLWGKYVPTDNPNEPIVYPTFSSLLTYTDSNLYCLDLADNNIYYDIDYNSTSNIKEGFLGSYWLAGAPYPNPVLYLSVHHKINERAYLNISLDIKSVYYVEIISTMIEDEYSNTAKDFTTYSFRSVYENLDQTDYIKNAYYCLNPDDLKPIVGYNFSTINNGIIEDETINSSIIKVNEVGLRDGNIYWLDSYDANGLLTNPVYIERMNSSYDGCVTLSATASADGLTHFFSPMTEDDCIVWKTSAKTIEDVAFFDIHSYTTDKATGLIMFNSGELEDFADSCFEFNGLVLGNITTNSEYYNYDEVIVAGTTTAYRTSKSYAQSIAMLDSLNAGKTYGSLKQFSVPIIDSYSAKDEYFLKNKESVMLIADPIINTASNYYYRFQEWVIFSRLNSGMIYRDVLENDRLKYDETLRFSSVICFEPQYSGYYVILPVYQRVFKVSVATEVVDSAINQGGSVYTYVKNGDAVDIDNLEQTPTYSVEYLKTKIGENEGYYFSNINFIPFAAFYSDNDDYSDIYVNTSVKQVVCFNNVLYCIIQNDDNSLSLTKASLVTLNDYDNSKNDQDFLKRFVNTSNNTNIVKLVALTYRGNSYIVSGQSNVGLNSIVNEVDSRLIPCLSTAEFAREVTKTSRNTTPTTYFLIELNGLLYVCDSNFNVTTEPNAFISGLPSFVENNEPIAKTNVKSINIIDFIKDMQSSIEHPGYSHSANTDLNAGDLAFDDRGNLVTHLVYKNNYFDRGSDIILEASPDPGYRFYGWFDDAGNDLLEVYANSEKIFSSEDVIDQVFKYGNNYYYKTYLGSSEEGFSNIVSSEKKVPEKLLNRVRGYYINVGTSVNPNLVEVFYSPAKENIYYDSAFTILADSSKMIGSTSGFYVKNGSNYVPVYYYQGAYYTAYSVDINEENVVTFTYNEKDRITDNVTIYGFGELTHFDTITSYTVGEQTHYYLNNVRIYKNDGEYGNGQFYRGYSSLNFEVNGNSLHILSLHTNIKFVARFKEIYQSMILTDEAESGIEVLHVYYFNRENNELAIRTDVDVEIVKTETIETFEERMQADDTNDIEIYDLFASIVDPSSFALFESSKISDSVEMPTILSVADIFDGYTIKQNYNGTDADALTFLTSEFYNGQYAGLFDIEGNQGKEVFLGLDEYLNRIDIAMNNLYFDENTSNIIVVRTLSTNPLVYHTLGIPQEYNLVPLIEPSEDYINKNATLMDYSSNDTATDYENYKADYFYYVFEVTYNRAPENENFNLIIHPNRELSVTNDIIDGNYMDFYCDYYDVSWSFTGTFVDDEDVIHEDFTKEIKFNLKDYFEKDTSKGYFCYKLKNALTFYSEILANLLDGFGDYLPATDSLIDGFKTMTDETQYFHHIFEIADYINYNILKQKEQNLNINTIYFSEQYLNELNNIAQANELTLSHEFVSNFVEYTTENEITLKPITIYGDNIYSTNFDVASVFQSLDTLIREATEEEKEDRSDLVFVKVFDITPVGNGSINFINLSSIRLYTFSVQSLTIDGYDENGEPIYNNDPNYAHQFRYDSIYEEPAFGFYTAVGTGGRTYVGSQAFEQTIPAEHSNWGYYNGTGLVDAGNGIAFTHYYVDENPSYKDTLPSYVYKDFMLAENTIMLLDGLFNTAESDLSNGYQFMGWYQQKHISSIADRFFDLDGNRLSAMSNVYLSSEIAADDLDDVLDILNLSFYFYDIQNNTLYHRESMVSAFEELVEGVDYVYKEWGSMELVSTTYAYPFVAYANADTIIAALFKKIVQFSYTYNPFELNATISTSVDSLNNPIKYTVTAVDADNQPVDLYLVSENINEKIYSNKADLYKDLTDYYQSSVTAKNLTYTVTVSGNFAVDATPTLAITPVGSYRLAGYVDDNDNFHSGIFDANGNEIDELNLVSITKNDITTTRFNRNLIYSNDNPLEDEEKELYTDSDELTFSDTVLTETVYLTVVLNNINELDSAQNEQNSNDATVKSIHLTAERVILNYSSVNGYGSQTSSAKFTFAITQNTNIDFGEKGILTDEQYYAQNIAIIRINNATYFISDLRHYVVLSDSELNQGTELIDLLVKKGLISNPNTEDDEEGILSFDDLKLDLTDLFNIDEHYAYLAINEGYLNDWIARLITLHILKGTIDSESETPYTIHNDVIDSIINEVKKSDFYKSIMRRFIKLVNNAYYYVRFTDVGIEFYGYFDTNQTTTSPLNLITIQTGDSTAIDHWYVNAKTPSTITNGKASNESESSSTDQVLNQDIVFPTQQAISFEAMLDNNNNFNIVALNQEYQIRSASESEIDGLKNEILSELTQEEQDELSEDDLLSMALLLLKQKIVQEFNNKFTLSNNNSVYHSSASIIEETKLSIAIALTPNGLIGESLNLTNNHIWGSGINSDNYISTYNSNKNHFTNALQFNYDGIKFASSVDAVSIQTIEDIDNNTANGTITTQYIDVNFSQSTTLTLSIDPEKDKFLTVNENLNLSQGDVYVFIGWYGTLVDTEEIVLLSTDTTCTVSCAGFVAIEARYAKISKVNFVNHDETEIVSVSDLLIEDMLTKLTYTNQEVQQNIFGYHENLEDTEDNYYYAIYNADINISALPDAGFVITDVYYSYTDNSFTLYDFPVIDYVKANMTYDVKTGINKFTIVCNSDTTTVKINNRPGYKVSIEQFEFKDYLMTGAGTKYTTRQLYSSRNISTDQILKFPDGIETIAENDEIKLKFTSNNGYAFIGWFINNELYSSEEETTITVDQDILIELRVVKLLKINFYAYTTSPELTLVSEVSKLININYTGGVINNRTYFSVSVKAGESIDIAIEKNANYTFKGWYYALNNIPEVCFSTQYETTFAINSDFSNSRGTSFIKDNNVTIVALFATTKTFTISKTINKVNTTSSVVDMIVTYKNASGVVVSENIGNKSTIEITALCDASDPDTTITLTSVLEKDYEDAYYFEGFWNFYKNAIITYNETYTFTPSNSKIANGTRFNANFTSGTICYVTRRLNDNPYSEDGLTVNLNYYPTTLTDGNKVVDGEHSFRVLGFSDNISGINYTTGIILQYTLDKMNDNHLYSFDGWYINNQKATDFDFVNINEDNQTIIINNVYSNFPNSYCLIEARFIDNVKITLSKTNAINGATNVNAQDIVTFEANAYFTSFNSEEQQTKIENLKIDSNSATATSLLAYNNSLVTLSAFHYAGYRFVGFKANGEFIKRDDDSINDDMLIYYHLTEPTDFVAYYAKEYTVNYIISNLGETNGTISGTLPTCVTILDVDSNEIALTANINNGYFLGFYNISNNDAGTLITGTGVTLTQKTFNPDLSFNQNIYTTGKLTLGAIANLIDQTKDEIYINIKFTKSTTISIVNIDDASLSDSYTVPYGVETTISDYSWWTLGDKSSPYHYGNLTILPIVDNATYYKTSSPTHTELGHSVSYVFAKYQGGLATCSPEEAFGNVDLGNEVITVTRKNNAISDFPITSMTIDPSVALSYGYIFIGWVAGIKYINPNNTDYMHYIPITNSLTISEQLLSQYNTIFALFVDAENFQLVDGDTTDNRSYNITLTTTTKYSSVCPALANLKTRTISTFKTDNPSNTASAFTAQARNEYTLLDSQLNNGIITTNTEKIYKSVDVNYYAFNDADDHSTEERLYLNENIDTLVKTSEEIELDADKIELKLTTVSPNITPSDSNNYYIFERFAGSINVANENALSNVVATSTANEKCYLSHYNITRIKDDITEEFTIYSPVFMFKILDGDVTITPVFKENFIVVLENTAEISQNGYISVENITEDDDLYVTKVVRVLAKDNYRIAAILLCDVNYSENDSVTPSQTYPTVNITKTAGTAIYYTEVAFTDRTLTTYYPNSLGISDILVSEFDEATATNQYINGCDIILSGNTNCLVQVVFTKVANIKLVDDYDKKHYELYFEAEELMQSASFATSTSDELSAQDIANLVTTKDVIISSADITAKKDITNIHEGVAFRGYFYNNVSLLSFVPSDKLNIATDTEYIILAKFAVEIEKELSVGIYYNDENINDQYSSMFNIPLDNILVKQIENNSTTTIYDCVIDGLLVTKTLTYTSDNSITLSYPNVNNNKYFVFLGWYERENPLEEFELISTNPSIEVASFSKQNCEIQARFEIITRTIVISPNYQGGQIQFTATNQEEAWHNINDMEGFYNISANSLSDLSTRRVFIGSEEINDKEYKTITYALASSLLDDYFFIRDNAFVRVVEDDHSKYYIVLGADKRYEFKNFTRLNDKALTDQNGDMVVEPTVKVNLSDFYQSQNLNINVRTQYKLELMVVSDTIEKLADSSLIVYVNGEETMLNGFAANWTFNTTGAQTGLISLWVNDGDRITVKATGEFLKMLDVAYGIVAHEALFNYFENDYIEIIQTGDQLTKLKNFIEFYFTNIANILTSSYIVNTDSITGNVLSYDSVDAVKAYSFIATNTISFVADYIPVLQYNVKYINDVISATGFDTLVSNGKYNGRSFAISELTPTDLTPFTYSSNEFEIITMLDRNNNIINLTNQTLNLPLSYRVHQTSSEYENSERVASKQTDSMHSIENEPYGENSIKVITSKYANVSVYAGITNAKNNIGDSDNERFNAYTTLYDMLIEQINNGQALSNDYLNIQSNYNDVQVKIFYSDENFESNPYEITQGTQKYQIKSIAQDKLSVGTKASISAKVVNINHSANYLFKGFLIINSNTYNDIDLYAGGDKLKSDDETSNNLLTSKYLSYQIINLDSVDALGNKIISETEIDPNTLSKTYRISNINLSGDVKVIALYELIKIQVNFMIKNLNTQPENLENQQLSDSEIYNEIVSKNLSLEEMQAETDERITVNVKTDPSSSFGKISSATSLIVDAGQPALISVISYPYCSLIGWATDTKYAKNKFAISSQDPITDQNEINKMFAELISNPGTTYYVESADTEANIADMQNSKLYLIDSQYTHNNLYIRNVQGNMTIGAYFTTMNYVISFTISEAELAPYSNSNSDSPVYAYDPYVSIIENEYDEATGELISSSTKYIQTLTDEFDRPLMQASRVPLRLISVEKSITDGEIDPLTGKRTYYLTYTTGVKVKDLNGNPIMIVKNNKTTKHVTTEETTEETGEDDVEDYIDVAITPESLFTETNITTANYSLNIQNDNYFTSIYYNENNMVTFKPGLISISVNGGQWQDAATLRLAAKRIDKDGNVVTDDQIEFDHYRIDYVVTAKNSSGFPTIKIKFNSPSDNTSIIPYTFDNSDYIRALKQFEEYETISQIYKTDRNANHDTKVITGFFNNVYNKTDILTDAKAKALNRNFTLNLVYAKTATKLNATIELENITKSELKTYGINNVANLTKQGSQQAINLVKNYVTSYKYYIVKDGAKLANDIFAHIQNHISELDDSQLTFLLGAIDILNNFTKYASINGYKYSSDLNGDKTYNNLSTLDAIGNNHYIERSIELIEEASRFAPNYSLDVEVIDVFGWFTGLKLANSLYDQLNNGNSSTSNTTKLLNLYASAKLGDININCKQDGTIDLNDESNNTYLKCSGNIYSKFVNNYPDSSEDLIYDNTQTSYNFTNFFVRSGDSVVTDVELALQLQNQVNYNRDGQIVDVSDPQSIGENNNLNGIEITKADKMYLYYNSATLSYTSTKSLGKLLFENDNDIERLIDSYNTNQDATTWPKVTKLLSALFSVNTQFEGIFSRHLVSSCALSGSEQAANLTINSKLKIDHNRRAAPAFVCPFWVNVAPFDLVETIIVIVGTIAAAVAGVVITVATAGTGAVLITGVTTVLIGATAGLVTAIVLQAAIDYVHNIPWNQLEQINKSITY